MRQWVRAGVCNRNKDTIGQQPPKSDFREKILPRAIVLHERTLAPTASGVHIGN